jgi:hypothetical protein
MFKYKIVNKLNGELSCILAENGTMAIPPDPANTDYQAYLAWLDEGNTPEPAEE